MTDRQTFRSQADSDRPVPGRPNVLRFRSKGHNTLIATNGAIRIESTTGQVYFSKPVTDGNTI